MAYGGAVLGPPGGFPALKQVKLEKESELRIEVGFNSSLRLRLLSGNAEIFGTELPPENWLVFPPKMKFAIFTWYGATIEMQDNAKTDYVADEGPRVIVVGPTDSGKSTLSKTLVSWAVKQGWKPTFVDLDIDQGSITLPGCIAATQIEMPIDPVKGFPLEMPLIYFFGHNTRTVNADLYKVLVKELAHILKRQFADNAEYKAAGMVINTMGFIDGLGYNLLLHAIDTFKANVVLVMGQDKLYSMLKGALKRKPYVDVVKLQKSDGVVLRNKNFRASARSQRIREFFYGVSNDLSPRTTIANFSDLAIYEIGGGPQASASALPIGTQRQRVADPMRLVPVNINRDLLNLVLLFHLPKNKIRFFQVT